jgi:hypothetical protein
MRNFLSSRPVTLVGTVLIGSVLACAPAPVDKETGGSSNTGGTSSSSSGSGGNAQTGAGGTGSGTGGTGSGSSGTGGTGSGSSGTGGTGSGSSGTGGGGSSSSGTGGNSGSSSGTGGGGSSPSGTGGAKADAGSSPADMGSSMPPAANGTKVPANVQALFMKCGTACHGGNWGDATKSYARLKGNAMCGNMPRMKAGDGAGSLVVQKLKGAVGGCGNKMPPSGMMPTADEIKTLEDWITAGAVAVP